MAQKDRTSQFVDRPTVLSRGSVGAPSVRTLGGANRTSIQTESRVGAAVEMPESRIRIRKLLRRLVALMFIGIILFNVLSAVSVQEWRQIEQFLLELIDGSVGQRGVDDHTTLGEASALVEVPESDEYRTYLDRALKSVKTNDDDRTETHFVNALFHAEKFGAGDSRLTMVLDHFGYFYAQRGRHEEALPHYLRALDGYRVTVGEAHEHFISLERRIARSYQAESLYLQAITHMKSATEATGVLHGPDYVGIAYGFKEMGDIRAFQGDAEGAASDYRQALEVARRTLAPNHSFIVELQQYLDD